MTTDSQRKPRGRGASLPVIVLTAQHGGSEEKALDLGAQDYLTTPAQTRSLTARVRAKTKRINTWPHNHLPDDGGGPARGRRGAWAPSLAWFLPSER
jgi:DNA-binding response OmpR family regulator